MRINVLKLTIFLLLLTPIVLYSKDIYIGGQILNKYNNESVADVNIFIPGTLLGVTSDQDGYFYLKIPESLSDQIVMFKHIAYDTLQIPLTELKNDSIFYLIPKIIRGAKITVEAEYAPPEIQKDIPQTVAVIDLKQFEDKGYIDAGDLLKTEQSIQIEEEISGKKTISMRGGNSDDVIVLYNGVKMNNPYDNTFDFSLINLDNIKAIEVIKGSNTALYGSDAFSGVINIIPNVYKDYTVKFVQRFGTYDSGDWNLQFNKSFKKKFHISVSNKAGGSRKNYSDSADDSEFLENKSSHQTVNLVYTPSYESENKIENTLWLSYLRSEQNYRNNRYYEKITDFNQLAYLRYSGSIGPVDGINFVTSYQWLDNDQQIPTKTGLLSRFFYNKSLKINLEKQFEFKTVELLFAYQFERNQLDFKDQRNYLDDYPQGLESVVLNSHKHGFASIFKLYTPTGSEFLHTADIDASFRYDMINDEQKNVVARNMFNELDYYPGKFDENKWNKAMYKMSAHFSGSKNDLNYDIFANTGSNFKFPSLIQQLSTPALLNSQLPQVLSSLNPERNRSTEVGIELNQEYEEKNNINNWGIILSYFKNLYENKFRLYYTPGIPVAFFDNVPDANISGIELRIKSEMLNNIVSSEFATSQYFITDRAAFPFKSEQKYIANVSVDYIDFFFNFHGFAESKQIGWYRDSENVFSEVSLPGFQNIDLVIGKSFEYKDFKFISSLSVRNLLNDDTQIYGLSIRDRRIYILFSVEY